MNWLMTTFQSSLLTGVAIDKRALAPVSAADQAVLKDVMTKLYVKLDQQNRTDNAKAEAALKANGLSFVPPAAGEVDMKGLVAGGWSFSKDTPVRIEYGIERFYLPEGEGLAIQNDIRERPFSMLVAVGKDGAAQIKALLDGDTVLFEEPLY